MPNVIEVEDLKKSFGEFEAVKGVSFSVEEGTTFGFLGPNGAGKSTTIKMLTTVLAPSEGRVLIAGHELGERAIGGAPRLRDRVSGPKPR